MIKALQDLVASSNTAYIIFLYVSGFISWMAAGIMVIIIDCIIGAVKEKKELKKQKQVSLINRVAEKVAYINTPEEVELIIDI